MLKTRDIQALEDLSDIFSDTDTDTETASADPKPRSISEIREKHQLTYPFTITKVVDHGQIVGWGYFPVGTVIQVVGPSTRMGWARLSNHKDTPTDIKQWALYTGGGE